MKNCLTPHWCFYNFYSVQFSEYFVVRTPLGPNGFKSLTFTVLGWVKGYLCLVSVSCSVLMQPEDMFVCDLDGVDISAPPSQ